MVTGMLIVLDFDVYALLDPGASLSFVTPFLAIKFGMNLEILRGPLSVYTPVGDSIIAHRVS